MPMYNLIEYSDNYSKTSKKLWWYYTDDPNDNIVYSKLLKFKVNITRKSHADSNTKNVKIAVPLKYLSKFWKTIEIPLITCELSIILIWSGSCICFLQLRKQSLQEHMTKSMS